MPYVGLLHPESLSLWQATADLYLCRRHSNTVLAQSLWGLWVWCLQGLFEPSECLWWVWSLILNAIFPLLPFCWGFSFALWCGVSFLVGSNILLLTVVQQWVVILEFLQEKMNTHPSTLPSWRMYICGFGQMHNVIHLSSCYTENFHHPQILFFDTSSPLPLPLPGNNWSFSVSRLLLFPECHLVGIIQYVAFSNWLLSLRNMHLKFLHAFSWLDSSLLFSTE